MESNEQGAAYTPEQARRALEEVSAARDRLVERAAIPWWYHLGIAAGIGIAISSFSMGHDLPSSLVPAGFILVPFALGWLVSKKTGVGLDFHRTTPSVLAPSWKWIGCVVLFVLVGAVLQWGFDLRWAMATAGLAVFGLTLIYSPRIMAAMLEDLRAGRTSR
ncbi:hypothetical protein [Nocardia concava]|uniref:hypothetical protein n=1 Tax=Nocardia concava TaxID=257281 RepID=UPI0003187FA7|nr:hypothetical protein [Nocardia concava]